MKKIAETNKDDLKHLSYYNFKAGWNKNQRPYFIADSSHHLVCLSGLCRG